MKNKEYWVYLVGGQIVKVEALTFRMMDQVLSLTASVGLGGTTEVVAAFPVATVLGIVDSRTICAKAEQDS